MNNDIINLLSGGIARGITVFKLYPIDTIKPIYKIIVNIILEICIMVLILL